MKNYTHCDKIWRQRLRRMNARRRKKAMKFIAANGFRVCDYGNYWEKSP